MRLFATEELHLFHCSHQLRQEIAYGTLGNPAQHRDEVVLEVDPDDVAAGAHGIDARVRRTAIALTAPVQPPQIAVALVRAGRCRRRLEPGFGEDRTFTPASAASHQQPQARLIARADEHAAAPVPSARHRLHAPATYLDPRAAIPVPLPVFGRA